MKHQTYITRKLRPNWGEADMQLVQLFPKASLPLLSLLHPRIAATDGLEAPKGWQNTGLTYTIPGWMNMAFQIYKLGMLINPNDQGEFLEGIGNILAFGNIGMTEAEAYQLVDDIYKDNQGRVLTGDALWQNMNLQLRIALLYSVLNTVVVLNKRVQDPIMYHPYHINNDARRLALSPRALEKNSQGKLDIVFPDSISPEELLALGSKNVFTLLNLIPRSSEKWIEEATQLVERTVDSIKANIFLLKALYPTLGFPTGVQLIPVRYGTEGSFANQIATLIHTLSEGGKYNPMLNIIEGNPDVARAHRQGSINKKPFLGGIVEHYSLLESVFKYPFVIFVRLPVDVDALDGFRDRFISLTIEEYLHVSIYHWSRFYQWPHDVEELFVHKILELNDLSTSSTEIELPNKTQKALEYAILRFHRNEITFIELCFIINQIIYVNKETRMEIEKVL